MKILLQIVWFIFCSCTWAYDIDSGLRVKTAHGNARIAAVIGVDPSSPLLIKKGENTISIAVVPPSDPLASPVRISTSVGTKALKLYRSCVWRGAESTYGSSGALCPANHGIVVSGNGDLLTYICCELPGENILVGPVVHRGDTCTPNEIAVGAHSSTQRNAELYCQAVDTTRYKLDASESSCVWSYSGTHGWGRASRCETNPPNSAPAPNGKEKDVGTDGCTGQTYGAFLVSRQNKKCSRQFYSNLLKN